MSATGNSGVDSLVRRVDDDWYARKFTKEKRLREALAVDDQQTSQDPFAAEPVVFEDAP